MLLSNDLIVLEIKDAVFYYIYNQFTHQLVKIHKLLYDFLLHSSSANGTIKEEDLSLEQKNVLIEQGILITDTEKYSSQKYIPDTEMKSIRLKSVYIHVTMLCNLQCDYCYQKNTVSLHERGFATEDWLKVLFILKDAGVENLIFTGGEPSLHTGLYTILESAQKLGFHITVLTNGTMLNVLLPSFEFIDDCIVSLDGLSASKRKGIQQYDVLGQILLLPKNILNKISVRSVVARNYEDEVMHLGNDLQKNGIPHIKTLCLPYADSNVGCIPDFDKYDLLDMDAALTECGAGTELIAIDAFGNIFPCQTLMNKEFIIANIFDSDWMDQLTENKTCQEIRDYETSKNIKCASCVFIHFCKGGCRSLAYSVYQDILHCNEFLCEYYKKCINKKIKSICDT